MIKIKNILLTRPKYLSLATYKLLQDSKCCCLILPMFSVRYYVLHFKNEENTALLMTSQNAVKAIKKSSISKKIHIYTAGKKTKDVLTALGFQSVFSTGEDASQLIDFFSKEWQTHKKIIYLRGKHITHDLKTELQTIGYNADEAIVYTTKSLENINKETLYTIKTEIQYILLYSTRTAKIFCDLAIKYNINLSQKVAICISQKVAEQISQLEWCEVKVAKSRNEEGIIELLKSYL